MGIKDRMALRSRRRRDEPPYLVNRPPASDLTAAPDHDGDDRPREGGVNGSQARSGVIAPLLQTIRNDILERLNYERVGEMSPESLRVQIRHVVDLLIDEKRYDLSNEHREQILSSIEDEMFGLGPIQIYMRDPDIADILVNGHANVYVERFGKLERTDTAFRDDDHVLQIIDRIVTRIGRHIDESSPMVDARLEDGSRVNAIIPPLAIDGPMLSIRRFGTRTLEMHNLLALGTLTHPVANFLKAAVQSRLNVLISGGTGSGKTTLLNALSAFIPRDERIITIEDSAELQLLQPHVGRLETRPPNIEGRGAVTQRDLVRNALRMRPDRIIVGEVRGDEALDMLQAMNTGHDGSMTTLHANSTRDALSRLETLVLFAGYSIPDRAIREQVASAIQLLVHVSRMADGSRRIVNVSEIVGMEGDVISTQDIFVFRRTGIGENGAVLGRHVATGVRPLCADRLQAAGIHIESETFAEAEESLS